MSAAADRPIRHRATSRGVARIHRGDGGGIPRDLAPDGEELARHRRPRTRAGCPASRPCPFVGCRHHLALDVLRSGALAWTYPGESLSELRETCSLDVAERGGLALEEVGELVGGLTRERIRQIEGVALARFRARMSWPLCSICRAPYSPTLETVTCAHVRRCSVCAKPHAFSRRSYRACSPECQREHDLRRKRRTWKRSPLRKCKLCCAPFKASNWSQEYCSREHAAEASKISRRVVHTSSELTCPICGEAFISSGRRRSQRKYCGIDCYDEAQRRAYHRAKTSDGYRRTCVECGRSFGRPEDGSKPRRRYCSDECMMTAKIERQRKRLGRYVREVECMLCGASFATVHSRHRYCSRECYAAAKVIRNRDARRALAKEARNEA